MLSARIQRDIWRQTGIYSTVGMSNANPLLAKLALDNEAKHTPTMRANWSYQECGRQGLVHSKDDRLLGGLGIGG